MVSTPRSRSILAAAATKEDTAPLLLNPSFLADFAVAQRQGEPMVMRGTAGHAVFVQIGEDFVGAIMPVRASDAPMFDVEWVTYFAAAKTEVAA